MSADIDSGLFLEVVEVDEGAVVTIGRREDIDAFEEVETKEKQEDTYCGKNADFYFTCMFHINVLFFKRYNPAVREQDFEGRQFSRNLFAIGVHGGVVFDPFAGMNGVAGLILQFWIVGGEGRLGGTNLHSVVCFELVLHSTFLRDESVSILSR